jgi:phosphoesterase RecJ-like protein
MKFNDIKSIIGKSNNIGISFHTSMDGDCIGSSLALMQGLRAYGKNCSILCKETLPDTFSYLYLSNEIDGCNSKVTDKMDCIICIDCGNVQRLNFDFDNSKRKYVLINIDHHVSNDYYGDFNYIDSNSSSMGEIIHELLKSLDIPINSEMATSLYTSIVTDTGWFRFSNTTPKTLRVAEELLTIGVNAQIIYSNIYENKKINNIKLQGLVINDMELHFSGKLCFMKVTQEMLEKLSMESKDASDIVNLGTQINGVEIAVLLRETNINEIKVSLRSKKSFNVCKIAEKFNGGGHIKASGCTIHRPIDIAKTLILSEIEKELMIWME